MKLYLALIVAAALLAPCAARADYAAGQKAYEDKEWIKAVAELRPLAEKGDDRAMVLLGNMYSDGKGVLPDTTEAMDLYKKAAALGNARAMLSIGALYQGGTMGAPDYRRAAQWFERGARAGDQAAAFFCGLALLRGDPTGKTDFKTDEKQSYKWLRIAAASTQYNNMQNAAIEAAKMVSARLTAFEMKTMNDEAAAFKPVDPDTLGPPPDDLPKKSPPPESPAKPASRPGQGK